MARYPKCPSCGRQTFGESEQVRRCTDPKCGVTGWLGTGPANHGGRGRVCQSCGAGTMKLAAKLDDGMKVHHCFSCAATYFA